MHVREFLDPIAVFNAFREEKHTTAIDPFAA
jgi:hypothetical protein